MEKINWQAQVQKRWLPNLLANKKVMASLLRFLKIIDVEGKKAA